MLPPEFVGVWERIGLTVDDAPIVAAGRSYWFQGPSQFIDVRAAGAGLPSEAFAGTTTWDGATKRLSWSHELDLHPGPSDDSGVVEWSNGDLIEHGTADTPAGAVDYSETWRLVTPGVRSGAALIIADLVDGVGRLAVCQDHAAVMIDGRSASTVPAALQAGHLTDRGWAWAFDLVLGLPLGIESRQPAAVEDDVFPWLGRTWRIVERAPSRSIGGER